MNKDINPNNKVSLKGITNKFKDDFAFTKAYE